MNEIELLQLVSVKTNNQTDPKQYLRHFILDDQIVITVADIPNTENGASFPLFLPSHCRF
jgi:hypothetical protein